jgi:hypothetical protein
MDTVTGFYAGGTGFKSAIMTVFVFLVIFFWWYKYSIKSQDIFPHALRIIIDNYSTILYSIFVVDEISSNVSRRKRDELQ